MKAPFEPESGRQTSPTTWEWPCGCIVHSFEGEMTVRACCVGHDDPLEEYTLAIVRTQNPNVEVERLYDGGREN